MNMSLTGISSLVASDGNMSTMESKHFNVSFYSDKNIPVSQLSFIDMDNNFCTAYLNHCSFTFKTCKVMRLLMTGQPSVQYVPTKLEVVADVVVVSAAMASPATVTQRYV